MQSKGAIRLVIIALAVASLWQLSFTAITRIQENKAAKVAQEQALQFVESNNVAADVREFVQVPDGPSNPCILQPKYRIPCFNVSVTKFGRTDSNAASVTPGR